MKFLLLGDIKYIYLHIYIYISTLYLPKQVLNLKCDLLESFKFITYNFFNLN